MEKFKATKEDTQLIETRLKGRSQALQHLEDEFKRHLEYFQELLLVEIQELDNSQKEIETHN